MRTTIFRRRTPMSWACAALLTGAVGSCDAASGPRPGEAGPTVSEAEAFAFSESIALVRDLTVLPSGEVWVLNSVEPLFVGFGADGSLLNEHGRFGGGPTEFGAPTAFVSGNIDGQAWVFDAERHILIEVSGPTTDRREIPLPADGSLPPTHLFGGRELIGAGARTARLGDEVIFALNAPAMEGGMLSFWRAIWSADLVSFDPGTGSVRPLISLAEVLGDPDEGFSLSGDFPPFPFWFRLWTVCDDTEVRVYDRLANRVRTFAPDGTSLESDTLPSTPDVRATREDLARVGFGLGMLEGGAELTSRATPEDSARVIDRLSARIDADPEEIASLLPHYVDLHCSSDGSLWLRRFDAARGDLGGGLTWVRISTSGATSEVGFPEGFDAYRFRGDRVWGVQRDAFDVATVAWLTVSDD